MTINLETQIISSLYDGASYTYRGVVNGHEVTAVIPSGVLDGFAGPRARQERRDCVARALREAANGKPPAAVLTIPEGLLEHP